MVRIVINIPEKTNRILNIIKAKYGLKDKSQAIKVVVDIFEPELKPEFIEETNKILKGEFKKYKSIEDLEKM
ncbi:MAG: DUF2683 family protein [Candidatus Nanoarchaeia archaeon]|nr:DUF2683 family protein [Candidatus Nanoarchaeia archaeon]